MDYSAEPQHSSLLQVRGIQPFNAEPFAASLVEFNITPENLLYCRNHGPVRQLNEDSYNIAIKGTTKAEVNLTLKDLKSNFPISRVVATLQVGGFNSEEVLSG